MGYKSRRYPMVKMEDLQLQNVSILVKKKAAVASIKNCSDDSSTETELPDTDTDTYMEDAQIKQEENSSLKPSPDHESDNAFDKDSDEEMEFRTPSREPSVEAHETSIKHPELIPDIDDPKFYCKACEQHLTTKSGYRNHLRTVHRMKPPTKHLPKNDSIPDPDNPNFYCSTCEANYCTRGYYRIHLQKMHKMELVPLDDWRKSPIKHLNMFPVWDDPSKYCPACEFTYSCKYSFRLHCQKIHEMQKPRNEQKSNIYDPNFHCKPCNTTFLNKTGLLDHCRFFHRQRHHIPRVLNTNVDPEISDPSNHCQSCEKTFYNKTAYKRHLQYVHRILGPPTLSTKDDASKFPCLGCHDVLSSKENYERHLLLVHSGDQEKPTSTIEQPSTTEQLGTIEQPSAVEQPSAIEQPDAVEQPYIHDPNFHCRVCQKNYNSKAGYHQHLRKVHLMQFTPLVKSKKPDTNLLPNYHDPQLYCCVCKKTYKSVPTYRTHCRRIHKVAPVRFVAPDAEIDKCSPDLHCAKCSKHFKSKLSYRIHLRRVHKIMFRKPKPSSSPSAQ